MVTARRAFLEAGWYAPFSEALGRIASACLEEVQAPVVLDAGCGEGYYTGRLAQVLGPRARIAAFDISKEAVRLAAQRYKGVEFAVAGVFAIPMADGAADCLVDIFAPMAQAEFLRVLRPGGFLLYAVPGRATSSGSNASSMSSPMKTRCGRRTIPAFAFAAACRCREASPSPAARRSGRFSP